MRALWPQSCSNGLCIFNLSNKKTNYSSFTPLCIPPSAPLTLHVVEVSGRHDCSFNTRQTFVILSLYRFSFPLFSPPSFHSGRNGDWLEWVGIEGAGKGISRTLNEGIRAESIVNDNRDVLSYSSPAQRSVDMFLDTKVVHTPTHAHLACTLKLRVYLHVPQTACLSTCLLFSLSVYL